MKAIICAIVSISLLGLGSLWAKEVKVGEPAPGFTLENEKGEEVSLADYKGQNLVLVFSRAHW